jgi:hypothetical protein
MELHYVADSHMVCLMLHQTTLVAVRLWFGCALLMASVVGGVALWSNGWLAGVSHQRNKKL